MDRYIVEIKEGQKDSHIKSDLDQEREGERERERERLTKVYLGDYRLPQPSRETLGTL